MCAVNVEHYRILGSLVVEIGFVVEFPVNNPRCIREASKSAYLGKCLFGWGSCGMCRHWKQNPEPLESASLEQFQFSGSVTTLQRSTIY
jgi:hypothetical protein